MQQRSVFRSLHAWQFIAALFCGAVSLAMWFLYFALYWPYRDLFDEAGRYLDETTMVVYHEQSGLLVIPAVASSILALALTCFWHARRPRDVDRQLHS